MKIYSDIIDKVKKDDDKYNNKLYSEKKVKLLKSSIQRKLFTDEIVEKFINDYEKKNRYNLNSGIIKLFQMYIDFVERFINDFKDRIFLKDKKENANELLEQFTSINEINSYFDSIREFIKLYIDYKFTMSKDLLDQIKEIKDLLMYDIEEKKKSELNKYIDEVSKFYIELQTQAQGQTQPQGQSQGQNRSQGQSKNRKKPQKGKGYIIDDPLDSEFYDNNKFEKSIADDPYDSDFYN